jgi:hypothetical protein
MAHPWVADGGDGLQVWKVATVKNQLVMKCYTGSQKRYSKEPSGSVKCSKFLD